MDNRDIQQIRGIIAEMISAAVKNDITPQMDDLYKSGQDGFSAISKYLESVESRLKIVEKASDNGIRKEIDDIKKMIGTDVTSRSKSISQTDITAILKKLDYLENIACAKEMNEANLSEAVYFALALENAAINANVDTIYDMFNSEFGRHASITYLNAIIRALKTIIRTDLSAVANSLLKKFIASAKTKKKGKSTKESEKDADEETDDEIDEIEEIEEEETEIITEEKTKEEVKGEAHDENSGDSFTKDDIENIYIDENDDDDDESDDAMDDIKNNLQDLKDEFADPTKKNPKSASRNWGIAKVYFHPDADKEDVTYIEDFVDINSEPYEVAMWKSYSRSPRKAKEDWLKLIEELNGIEFRYHDRLALPKSAITNDIAQSIENKINEKKSICVTIIIAYIKNAEYILGYHFGSLLTQEEFEESYLRKKE